MIKDVRCLAKELEFHTFMNGKVAEDGSINILSLKQFLPDDRNIGLRSPLD
jgi:hypothetical protein